MGNRFQLTLLETRILDKEKKNAMLEIVDVLKDMSNFHHTEAQQFEKEL